MCGELELFVLKSEILMKNENKLIFVFKGKKKKKKIRVGYKGKRENSIRGE